MVEGKATPPSSDTPETDAVCYGIDNNGEVFTDCPIEQRSDCPADHARTLERSLAAATKSRDALRNEFDRLITSAGIEGRWTPNLLRHTAASLMADAGLPIEHVADQLGHKDLRMLQQHYRHRIKPTIGGAHILDGVLGANPPSPDR